MKRLQAYKFELRPNGEQARAMRRFAGACRFLCNKALAWQKERYAAGHAVLACGGTAQSGLPMQESTDSTQGGALCHV